MGVHLVFGVLGPLEVRLDGAAVRVGGPRQRALLGLLLCHANRVVSRDQLIEELLGDQPAATADRMLRVQVSRLRKALGDGNGNGNGQPRLLVRPPGYLLRVEDGELDLQAFEQQVAAGRQALADGDPAQAAALLREAESLWRGRPLADLEFESFARLEVRRLETLRLQVIEDRIDAELAHGRHTVVCPELEQLVAEHPLRTSGRPRVSPRTRLPPSLTPRRHRIPGPVAGLAGSRWRSGQPPRWPRSPSCRCLATERRPWR